MNKEVEVAKILALKEGKEKMINEAYDEMFMLAPKNKFGEVSAKYVDHINEWYRTKMKMANAEMAEAISKL